MDLAAFGTARIGLDHVQDEHRRYQRGAQRPNRARARFGGSRRSIATLLRTAADRLAPSSPTPVAQS